MNFHGGKRVTPVPVVYLPWIEGPYVQLSPGGPSRARAGVAVQVLDATFEPSHQPVEFTPIVLSSRGRRQKARGQAASR